MIKNKIIYKLIILLITISPALSYGQIIPVDSIDSQEINKIANKVDDKTLVLINIDNTIIAPKSKLFRYNNNPYIFFIDNLLALGDTRPDMNARLAQLILQRQVMLVEKNWPDFINKLKAKGALVFGFVKTQEPYRLIANFEELQYKQLSSMNVNFTNKIINKEIFKFDDKDSRSATFYKGIIFTGWLSKTQTLIKFLNLTNLKPLKIIIFENKKIELERLNSFLRTVDIDYYGIEYLTAKELKGSPDIKIGKFQQDTLLETGKWLEDEEAERLLNASSE